MEQIELKSLIGKHYLTGVDFETNKVKLYEWSDELEDSQVLRFTLDDKTYLAHEDPNDGYRSCMGGLKIIPESPKNVFQPIEVYCVMMPDSNYCNNDVLQFYDVKNNKIVLEIGTENNDDYYPSFVGRWNPENLHINEGK